MDNEPRFTYLITLTSTHAHKLKYIRTSTHGPVTFLSSFSNLAVISVSTYLHEFDSYVYYWMSTRLRITRLHLRRVRQP